MCFPEQKLCEWYTTLIVVALTVCYKHQPLMEVDANEEEDKLYIRALDKTEYNTPPPPPAAPLQPPTGEMVLARQDIARICLHSLTV